MTRTAALIALGMLLTMGCGGETEEAGEAEIPADTVLAEALTLVFLAEARADATGEPRDSLRAVALLEVARTTGLDSSAVNDRLDNALRRPEEAEALFREVSERIERLRL